MKNFFTGLCETTQRSFIICLVYVFVSMTLLADLYAAEIDCGHDVSSAFNNYGGFYNSNLNPHFSAFAAIKADGSISTWGHVDYGGSGAPTDSDYISIASNNNSFAALKADGSITAWGSPGSGGSGAPMDSSYVRITSTKHAFAALKADGSISAWGSASYGGSGAPADSGYVRIASALYAFAAIKSDGSISTWGHVDFGGSGAPTDSGYVKIASNEYGFAAMKADGSITAWGLDIYGGVSGAPTDSGYVSIASALGAFAAMRADGSIMAWGYDLYGGSGEPTDSGYVGITSASYAFAALKADGSISTWGHNDWGGSGAPADSGYIKITSNETAFAAMKADGSISVWGNPLSGGSGAPTDTGYLDITAAVSSFAAIKPDGSISAWGIDDWGGSGAPTDSGYVSIVSTKSAFAAMKADGSITVWGNAANGGSGAPTDSGYLSINGVGPDTLTDCVFKNLTLNVVINTPAAGSTVNAPTTISGTATSPVGVQNVLVGIRDQATKLWWNNSSWGDWVLNPVAVSAAGDNSVSWNTSFDPSGSGGSGQYRVFVRAVDVNDARSESVAQNFNIASSVALASVIDSPAANATFGAPVNISGTATAPTGVQDVLIGIRDQVTSLWWNNGSWGSWVLNPVGVTTAGDSNVTWSTSFDPTDSGGSGRYRVFARAQNINGLLSSEAAAVNFRIE